MWDKSRIFWAHSTVTGVTMARGRSHSSNRLHKRRKLPGGPCTITLLYMFSTMKRGLIASQRSVLENGANPKHVNSHTFVHTAATGALSSPLMAEGSSGRRHSRWVLLLLQQQGIEVVPILNRNVSLCCTMSNRSPTGHYHAPPTTLPAGYWYHTWHPRPSGCDCLGGLLHYNLLNSRRLSLYFPRNFLSQKSFLYLLLHSCSLVSHDNAN